MFFRWSAACHRIAFSQIPPPPPYILVTKFQFTVGYCWCMFCAAQILVLKLKTQKYPRKNRLPPSKQQQQTTNPNYSKISNVYITMQHHMQIPVGHSHLDQILASQDALDKELHTSCSILPFFSMLKPEMVLFVFKYLLAERSLEI